MPSTGMEWPCEISTQQLNTMTELIDTDQDPIMKKKYSILAKQTGMQSFSIRYLNIKYQPVSASCDKGKLEGLVDYWVDYQTETYAVPIYTELSRIVAHIQFNAVNGVPQGILSKSIEVLDKTTHYTKPETAALMAKQPKRNPLSLTFSATQLKSIPSNPTDSGVSISHIDMKQNGIIVTLTSTAQPFGTDRYETEIYGNFGGPSHKDSTTRYKNGVQHGAQNTYAGSMGPFPVPPVTKCYENGELVMANPCDVQ